MSAEILEKQMPPKSYYVLGTDWYCYVEPTANDLEFLSKEDRMVEIATKAVEAFFGLVVNDTLVQMDKEVEPQIGVVLAIVEKGGEDKPDDYDYIPSYLPLGGAGRYAASRHTQNLFAEWLKQADAKAKARLAVDKTRQPRTNRKAKSLELPAAPKPPATPPEAT
jgi:hypothetical protein